MAANRKRLLDNFVSLSAVQGINILFPLITFPYLIRVLGIEGFGIFSLVQTFVMYFDLLVSFGFGLTATKRISASVDDELMLKKIISAVYIIKAILFAGSFFIFIACSFTPYLKEHFYLLPLASLYLLGNMLLPDWYFQGIQKMRSITLVSFTAKTISLLLILILVKKNTDIEYAILAMSAGNLVAGIIAIALLLYKIRLKFKIPGYPFIREIFIESSYVFLSIILAPLYSSVNIFILRFFTNPLIVGYYAIADKIMNAISMLTSIINRTFYPHLSKLFANSIKAYKKYINKLVLMIAGIFLLFAVLQFFGATKIVQFLLKREQGEDIASASILLKIMSIALFFSPFVSFFFQLMIIQGQKKEAIANIALASIVNLISASFFTWKWGSIGLAINLCLMVILIFFLNRRSFLMKIKSLDN